MQLCVNPRLYLQKLIGLLLLRLLPNLILDCNPFFEVFHIAGDVVNAPAAVSS